MAAFLAQPVSAFAQTTRAQWCDVQQGVPASRLEKMRRGFNLTGWLDGPTRRRPDISVLQALRARGFTHVRLPLRPESIATEFSEPYQIADTFDELAFAIDTLLKLGISVSVDLHPSAQVAKLHRENPEQGLLLLDRLWTDIVLKLRRYPADSVFFEVLNEPDVPPKVWQAHGRHLAATIRRLAPQHTIIYAPPTYQTIEALSDLVPLDDPNVVYAVHFYSPMVFTHQGLTWDPSDARRYIAHLPFPASSTDPAVAAISKQLASTHPDALRLLQQDLQAPWTEQRISDEIAKAAAWMKQHRRPVIVNEFGVLKFKATPGDRGRWLSAVTRSAENFCIGWAHWEFADGFGFVSKTESGSEIDETIVRALLRN